MVLGRRPFTAGDKRLVKVNYNDWLAAGATLDSAAVTTTDTGLTITAVTAQADYVTFLLEASEDLVANETFTLSVQIVDTLSQIKNDTLEFVVQTP